MRNSGSQKSYFYPQGITFKSRSHVNKRTVQNYKAGRHEAVLSLNQIATSLLLHGVWLYSNTGITGYPAL